MKPTSSEIVEIYENFFSSILSTVHWTLGVSIAIAMSVLAFVWYSFNRNFTSEANRIREDITSSINSTLSKKEREISNKLSEISTNMNESENRIEDRLQKYRSDVQRSVNQLLDEQKNIVESSSDSLRSEIDAMRKKIDYLALDVTEHEIDYWKRLDVPANIISACAEHIGVIQRLDFEFMIDGVLVECTKAVENITNPSQSTINRMEKIYTISKSMDAGQSEKFLLLLNILKQKMDPTESR